MPNYTAPLDDMLFLFEKLRDNKNYNEIEKYNEVNSDLVKDILGEAAKISEVSEELSEVTLDTESDDIGIEEESE